MLDPDGSRRPLLGEGGLGNVARMAQIVKDKHYLGRPPKGSEEVERLTANGRWVRDDGKPGRAFSGRAPAPSDAPMAWYPDCDCTFDECCPGRQASARTVKRWSCSNGDIMRRTRRKR